MHASKNIVTLLLLNVTSVFVGLLDREVFLHF